MLLKEWSEQAAFGTGVALFGFKTVLRGETLSTRTGEACTDFICGPCEGECPITVSCKEKSIQNII